MTRTIINILIASMTAIAAHADSTDLIEAARTNDVDQVTALLVSGADTNGRDENGNTALHLAAGYGFADVARLLVDYGADVDAVGCIDNTPLLIAAQEGHTDVVRILVDNEASMGAKDEFGGTAMRYAAGRGHRQVVEILRSAEAQEQNLLADVTTVVAAAIISLLAAVA